MMIPLSRLCIAAVLTLPFAASIYGQSSPSARGQTPAGESLLSIGGEVERALKLTAAGLAKLPRRTVTAKDHDGKDTSFEGVELDEVLKPAGTKFGEALRGKSLALFLVVDAADGYRAVFSLPELCGPRFEIAARRHSGQKQSSASPVSGGMCGSASHQQFSRPSSGPHVKLTPHFEQTFCRAMSGNTGSVIILIAGTKKPLCGAAADLGPSSLPL